MKIYRLGDKKYTGETLYQAILDSSRGSYDPVIISDWIDDQVKQYKEDTYYDGEKIYNILFDNRMIRIVDILQMKGYDMENETLFEFDRNDIDKFITMYENDEPVKIQFIRLKELFEQRLENNERDYERAAEDYNLFIGDIDKDNDLEVANFFGFDDYEIIGFNIYGDDFSYDDVEMCKNCTSEIVLREMEQNYNDCSDEVFDNGKFYCTECGAYYDYDSKHAELNKHNKEKVLLKMI
jgi:hypothetical protein